MTRTSYAAGRITSAPAEFDVIFQDIPMFAPPPTDGVLYFHGSAATATSVYADPVQKAMLDAMAKTSVVLLADFGLQTWGNDTVIARAVEAMNYGEANLGVEGPWTFIGSSMGNSSSFATAKAHPSRVKAIGGIIPLMSIPDIMSRGAAAEVNVAYGGAYNDAVHGPTHSPISMAETIDPTLPIHLWCAPDDALVPLSIAQAFEAARPQTDLTVLPNGGHSIASIGNAAAGVLAFVAEHAA